MLRLSTLASALFLAAACGPPPTPSEDPHDLPIQGDKPAHPLGKLAFTLTDTEGRPFDFRKETDGYLTLLFFGYTSCPDICPLHMANIGAALKELHPDLRGRVKVVFVSVDPQRDTPTRLRGWLDAFDSTFVGLLGTEAQVADILAEYNYPPPERLDREGTYLVGHPAAVYAFTPDDLGRAMYRTGTRRSVWVHDLTLLAAHDWSTGDEEATVVEASHRPDPGALRPPAEAGALRILAAYAPPPAPSAPMAVYLTLENVGSRADTLAGIGSDAAERGSLHAMSVEDGMMRMTPLPRGIEILPGAVVRLEPGGMHGMLEGLARPPAAGDTVSVALSFTFGGGVTVPVTVVPYARLDG
ncbi:MAG: SCO family protein [Gemmatimonadota bacterium]|nr:SCO family protein [Gemmatimonadota bacterium]MDH5758766.1 SCO family protein [Gemmatimonadota bacterium]